MNVRQITMEDLQVVEHIAREDPKVIEQCGILGINRQDMSKVYCDRECLSTRMASVDVLTRGQPGRLASTNALAIRSAYSKP
jgi:Cu2+-containing amine oxidase